MPTESAHLLVLACGNPSRGDDALGPLLIDRLMREPEFDGVALLTDFQLQIEHVLDLQGRDRVLFVDAAASGPAPFALSSVRPELDRSITTHALSPGALLQVFQEVMGCAPPAAWLLAIRGYRFALGADLSAQARANWVKALEFVLCL